MAAPPVTTAAAPPAVGSAAVPVRARATAGVPSPGDGRPVPRYQGTLYGSPEEAEVGTLTMYLPVHRDPRPSSLTGDILAQGWADETPAADRSTARVVLALAVGLGVLIVIGLLVVVAVGGTFGTLVGGMLSG